jgi:hypothetical protein
VKWSRVKTCDRHPFYSRLPPALSEVSTKMSAVEQHLPSSSSYVVHVCSPQKKLLHLLPPSLVNFASASISSHVLPLCGSFPNRLFPSHLGLLLGRLPQVSGSVPSFGSFVRSYDVCASNLFFCCPFIQVSRYLFISKCITRLIQAANGSRYMWATCKICGFKTEM